MFRNPIPFKERQSGLRAGETVPAYGCPAFVFGFSPGRMLPVFRFSRVNRPLVESYLVYLMENGYRSLNAGELEEVIAGRRPVESGEVVLTFDHAWASLWTVVGPLLKRYDFQAVAYAIPGRVPELPDLRPRWGEKGHDPDIDHSRKPFCSWVELQALQEEGRVDIQSNSWSHGRIFCSDQFESLIEPETRMGTLDWPMLNDSGEALRFLSPSNVFHPLLPARSRLSDAYKHDVDPSVVARIHDDPDAAPFVFRQHFLQVETAEEREEAVHYELERSRKELELRLGKPVHQLSLPWGVYGRVAARRLEKSGYRSAVADRMARRLGAYPGQNPFRIGRLPYPYIRALPGRSRKLYWRIR